MLSQNYASTKRDTSQIEQFAGMGFTLRPAMINKFFGDSLDRVAAIKQRNYER